MSSIHSNCNLYILFELSLCLNYCCIRENLKLASFEVIAFFIVLKQIYATWLEDLCQIYK